LDLERVEYELKNRWRYPYKWGRKQSDSWDSQTAFIYTTYSVNALIRKSQHLSVELQNYAFNRWYNYWSAMAVEDIFKSNPKVNPNPNIYDKYVDFTIDGIEFDHKNSIFPRGFNNSYSYARDNELELIKWLYANQSQEGRKHLRNRLFVVFYDKFGKHWKMKAEIMMLQKQIDSYLNEFDQSKLYELDFGKGVVYADIIWLTRE